MTAAWLSGSETLVSLQQEWYEKYTEMLCSQKQNSKFFWGGEWAQPPPRHDVIQFITIPEMHHNNVS